MIQERVAENREGEIARLTKVMEDIAMEEEIRRRIVVGSVMTQTDTSGAEVTEGVHAVPNASEQPESEASSPPPAFVAPALLLPPSAIGQIGHSRSDGVRRNRRSHASVG